MRGKTHALLIRKTSTMPGGGKLYEIGEGPSKLKGLRFATKTAALHHLSLHGYTHYSEIEANDIKARNKSRIPRRCRLEDDYPF